MKLPLLLALVLAAPLAAQQPIRVDSLPAATTPFHPRIVGRTEPTTGNLIRYQWPGVYILARFSGPAVYFRVATGPQHLRITLNGHTATTEITPGLFRIDAPGAGPHTLRLDVINENQAGPQSLGDFALPAGAHALPAPANPRQIEFIGDSHTVGYGNTSTTRDCTQADVWRTTDTSQSLAADTAAALHADYAIDAISGHGVVRNYNGSPGIPVPAAYPFTLLDGKTRYADPAWKPQVIVIALGTNDFSTPLHAGEPWKNAAALDAAYETTYLAFLKSLRAAHPRALLVLWATDTANGKVAAETSRVAARFHDTDVNIAFVEVPHLSFAACHSHPTTADDATIAHALTATIQSHRPAW